MRKKRKTGIFARQYALIVLLALIIPAGVNFLRSNAETIGGFGERIASFAAIANMPEEGLELLRGRFQSELLEMTVTADRPLPLLSATRPPDMAEARENIREEEREHEPSPKSDRTEENPAPFIASPKIPPEFQGEIIEENFAGKDGGILIKYGSGYIKNDTGHSAGEIEDILKEKMSLSFEDIGEPQVLILHTHATESFESLDSAVYDTRNTWRSTDNNNNMVAVGAAMASVLEENGIGVIHDTTQHDNPSYNSSYQRSAKTVAEYLEEYPGIKVILDLHRDAMERENQAIVKPTAMIDGRKASQIMIISGCDDGTMDMPGWRENLRFAAAFTDAMESRYPQLSRPVYFGYRKYNQHLSPGALLLEFGSNANTLDEALYAATLAGQALADLIWENTPA